MLGEIEIPKHKKKKQSAVSRAKNIRKELGRMQKVIFVIGANATGKTYFINRQFAGQDVEVLNIYDFQRKAYDEAGFGKMISFGAEYRCLRRANEMHLNAIIEALRQGRDVVVEQTFYKAKRRITYIDAIRTAVNAGLKIEVYVMCPNDERWAENLRMREFNGTLREHKVHAEKEFEFPNPIEGFDAIYEVRDDKVSLRMNLPEPAILVQARKELTEELQQNQREDEEKRKREELLESMKTRPFWHYCEVCGKKKYITAQEAYEEGWDYPPHMGKFGLLGPRTCGECSLEDTLFWKVNTEKKVPIPIVVERLLTPEEKVTWRRIKSEPKSLLE